MQPQIHLVDETWIEAGVDKTSAAVANPVRWRLWWPTLHLTVTRDRGLKGIQWAARSLGGAEPALAGTVELWLEPFRDGVLVHHFLRLDPVDGKELPRRTAARTTRRFAWQAKRAFWQLKDELEATSVRAGAPRGPGR